MNRILLSLLAIALVVSGGIMATRAFFTNQSVLGANTISSGTLAISATSNDKSYLDLGTFSKLAPGDITPEYTITVKNSGDINAATFGKFNLTEDGGLASALKFYQYRVQYYKADGTPVHRWATNDGYYGSTINEDYFIKDGDVDGKWAAIGASTNLTEWTNIVGKGAEDLPPTSWDMEGLKIGYYYVITFRLQMDPNAGNAFQNKYVNLGYEVQSTQVNPTALAGLSSILQVPASTLSDGTWGAYGFTLNQINTY